MDLWVVAAAAGAGYLAKYWQNILRDKEGSSGFPSGRYFPDEPESPSLIQRLREKTCPINKLSRAKSGNGDTLGEVFAETFGRDGPGTAEVSNTSGSGREIGGERYEEGDVSSSSTLPLQFRNHREIEEYKDGYGLDADMGDIPEYQTWEMGASHGSKRSKKSLRSKHLHLQYIKPRTSLDSCLMAQMQREHAELEEYLRTPLSSPCTTSLRPFLVSDGRRIISRARGEFREAPHKEVYLKAENEVVGVPRLPRMNAADYSKQKFNRCKNQMQKAHNTNKLMQFDTPDGRSHGQHVFCLGISIGIIFTIIANKLELEKLNERLKQSENLVDDLQEELEMKDSLTVKELVNDDDSQDIHESSSCNENMNLFSNQADTDMLKRYAGEESTSLRKDESISRIEAELEAELERLELSMKGSALPGRLSDAVELGQELDQDIVAELVHGELLANMVGGKYSSEPTPGRGSHSTPTPHSMKDGVSPHELSLRLHEVIQSRLENRVLELEAELSKSQKRIEHFESERTNFWREVSNSESSSSRCSPRNIEAHSPMAQPLVMNLSGDALDAYNEAFEELNKLNGSEDERSPLQVVNNQYTDVPQSGFMGTRTSLALKREETLSLGITGMSSCEDSPNAYHSKDYDEDNDLWLIKQIVEKAKQGSPAIFKAQKAMVTLDKDDY